MGPCRGIMRAARRISCPVARMMAAGTWIVDAAS
jgi:hypothetical protein